MDYNIFITEINNQIKSMKQTQDSLQEQLLALETGLNQSIEKGYTINEKLKDLIQKKRMAKAQHIEAAPQAPKTKVIEKHHETKVIQESTPDVKAQLEKLLQGSLDALGDKISDKLMNMMKELKTTAGPMRYEKMQQIKQLADEELVDLSSLYAHTEVKSNIEDVGVDEKEAKSVDSSLEKLRQMRKKKKP